MISVNGSLRRACVGDLLIIAAFAQVPEGRYPPTSPSWCSWTVPTARWNCATTCPRNSSDPVTEAPHAPLTVEYTDNLAGPPGQQLLVELNAVVCGHPTVQDEADVKARLLPLSCFEIGTAPAQRGFVRRSCACSRPQRDAVKKELSDAMAAVLHRLTPQPPGMLVTQRRDRRH